jgi:hypothetical protein
VVRGVRQDSPTRPSCPERRDRHGGDALSQDVGAGSSMEQDAGAERVPQAVPESNEVSGIATGRRRARLDLDPHHVAATQLGQDIELKPTEGRPGPGQASQGVARVGAVAAGAVGREVADRVVEVRVVLARRESRGQQAVEVVVGGAGGRGASVLLRMATPQDSGRRSRNAPIKRTPDVATTCCPAAPASSDSSQDRNPRSRSPVSRSAAGPASHPGPPGRRARPGS